MDTAPDAVLSLDIHLPSAGHPAKRMDSMTVAAGLETKQWRLFRCAALEDLLPNPNTRRDPAGPDVLWQLGLLVMWQQPHGVG